MSGMRGRIRVCSVVHAFVDERRKKDRDANRAEQRDQPVFVAAATHKDGKACRRQNEQQHPKVEILVHEETRRDNRQRNNKNWR